MRLVRKFPSSYKCRSCASFVHSITASARLALPSLVVWWRRVTRLLLEVGEILIRRTASAALALLLLANQRDVVMARGSADGLAFELPVVLVGLFGVVRLGEHVPRVPFDETETFFFRCGFDVRDRLVVLFNAAPRAETEAGCGAVGFGVVGSLVWLVAVEGVGE